jgi:hypothetical protein
MLAFSFLAFGSKKIFKRSLLIKYFFAILKRYLGPNCSILLISLLNKLLRDEQYDLYYEWIQ